MNNKEIELNRIVEIVTECCATKVNDDGDMSLYKEDILGKSRSENVVMTRCILVQQLLSAGYSITTCSQLLNRTIPAIRHLNKLGYEYLKSSRAYRIANAEATLRCRDELNL